MNLELTDYDYDIGNLSRDELPYRDDLIDDLVRDSTASLDLWVNDQVTWLRGSIAVRTNRAASRVTDNELLRRYHNYGRQEWDPLIAKSVADYLKSAGFFVIPGIEDLEQYNQF